VFLSMRCRITASRWVIFEQSTESTGWKSGWRDEMLTKLSEGKIRESAGLVGDFKFPGREQDPYPALCFLGKFALDMALD